MPTEGSKFCVKCKILKPLEQYHRRHDGFHSYCKTCRKKDARSRRGENRAELNEKARLRRVEHLEEVREYQRNWQRKNRDKQKLYYERTKEKRKQQGKEYREKNKEKLKEKQKIYIAKNREKLRAYKREYHKKNKQRRSEIGRLWREQNPDRVKENHRRWYEKTREKRLKEQYGLTIADEKAMLIRQDGLCAICQNPSKRRLVVDHPHGTNKARALLCDGCNTAIGFMKDDAARLRKAAEYIEYHDSLQIDQA